MSNLIQPIECEQLFSKKTLGFLWSKRDMLDAGQVSILDALFKNKTKKSIEGCSKVVYSLSKTEAGKLGYGRLYGTKGSFETLERECRGTLCSPYYVDVDVANCHPVLLYQLAKNRYNVDLIEVEKYCDNRSEYLSKISDNKDIGKSETLKVFYNGTCLYPFLEPMKNEIRNFTKKHLMKDPQHSDLLDYIVKQDKNTYGTFLSDILQTEERHVMTSMRRAFMKRNHSVDVLCYDGVMVRKNDKNPVTDDTLRAVERDIYEETKYEVVLVTKPFESYDVPEETDEDIEVSPKVSKKLYDSHMILK